MSAGAFDRSVYAATYNPLAVHPIRVQPETAAASNGTENNAPTESAITNPISAVVSKGRRARGLRPRTLTLQFPLTGQPTGYKAGGYTTIPALTADFYNAVNVGDTITYLGVTCVLVSKSPEEVS